MGGMGLRNTGCTGAQQTRGLVGIATGLLDTFGVAQTHATQHRMLMPEVAGWRVTT